MGARSMSSSAGHRIEIHGCAHRRNDFCARILWLWLAADCPEEGESMQRGVRAVQYSVTTIAMCDAFGCHRM